MRLVAWNASIADLAGDVAPDAVVTVLQGGLPADLFDQAGAPLPSNQVDADENGKVTFYARPGVYDITANLGTFSITWNDVPLAPVSSYIESKAIAGTSHTVTADDLDQVLVFDTPDPVTVTLPNQATEALLQGHSGGARNKQAGKITFQTQGSDVLAGAGSVTADPGKTAFFYLEEAADPATWVTAGDFE